jgi:carbonic anhydrase/acetyltransferase-like protein (isoleucine patch superfamily)
MTQSYSLPGLGLAGEQRLSALLNPRVTSLTAAALAELPMTILGAADPGLRRLGLIVAGHPDLTVVVTDPDRPIGTLRIEVGGPGNLLFFDNRAAAGCLHGNIRILGGDCAVLFDNLGDNYVALHDVFLRSGNQLLFWGAGASAVGCSIELEGEGRSVVIGEDALISSDIWIRNHDMHAVHDIRTGGRINRAPVDTVLERHVWVGQAALLLNCERIGMGSIVGAMSLVKGVVGEYLAVAGCPARVIRYQVSWGREAAGMTEHERFSMGLPPLPG